MTKAARKKSNKGVYRPRAVGKGVERVGVTLPEGLARLVDRMVRAGLGTNRQDVILRALAAFAVMESSKKW